MYLSTGAFLRGKFKDGFLEGIVYLKPTVDQSYLMKMDLGVLQGETTTFNGKTNNVKIMQYKDGRFQTVLKEFENYVDKCHDSIVRSVFGISPEVKEEVLRAMEESNQTNDPYIGSFLLDNGTWYHGVARNGVPTGFGLMHQQNGKV